MYKTSAALRKSGMPVSLWRSALMPFVFGPWADFHKS
jgi:hypothetical protein